MPKHQTNVANQLSQMMQQLLDLPAKLVDTIAQLADATKMLARSTLNTGDEVSKLTATIWKLEAQMIQAERLRSLHVQNLSNSIISNGTAPLSGPNGLLPPPIRTCNELAEATEDELDALYAILEIPYYPEDGTAAEKRLSICGYLGVPVGPMPVHSLQPVH